MVDQALEVMAGHVGVQREGGGHFRRGHPGLGPHVQEDVTAGGVAEGGRHGGHGGGECAVVLAGGTVGASPGCTVVGAVLTIGSLPRDHRLQLGEHAAGASSRRPGPTPRQTRECMAIDQRELEGALNAIIDPELGLALGEIGFLREVKAPAAPGPHRGRAAGGGLAYLRRTGRRDPPGGPGRARRR